ncbi:Pimeloyl-ACP methyl ester carboxylesterase [Chitinophaga eiseniae]|uniref:Pimeloyl-ACP methyl ester carboxylesterase n=1 Tax=Chitinophaga eiseniae TaxID=634771 RepID=A0A1T4TBF4_9BACT|nr:alpha/beta fold hydrolase [Chitinophaga eiseniae]SKA37812.1 Pimeloyl-ACP methyl ester carboxylesterase [Chitinophaga eiseniae]
MKILICLVLALPGLFSFTLNNNIMQHASEKTGQYATINGIRMYYEIHGNDSGIPLVLVHGGGSTIPSNWGTLLPLLAPHYKVIAMELQAHGRTGDRNAPESFQQDAADVAALLQYLHIRQANIVGFSDGACTTMEIAIHHPAIAHKIVLISGNYLREGMVPGFFEGMEKATFADMPAPLTEAYLEVNPDQQGVVNMFNKDRAKRMGFRDRTTEDMQSIHAPALVIGGDRDVITTRHFAEMSQVIPGARLAILPGNHGSFIGERLTFEAGSPMPGITAGIIRTFLDGQP